MTKIISSPVNTEFRVANTGDVQAVRRHTHRYWALEFQEGLSLGQNWVRWIEIRARTKSFFKINRGDYKYILDVIDNKVVHCSMSLRELEMMNRRAWLLKDKMLEAVADRHKGKAFKRTLDRYAK